MSILMQTALSEDSASMTHGPEDSHYRREYVSSLKRFSISSFLFYEFYETIIFNAYDSFYPAIILRSNKLFLCLLTFFRAVVKELIETEEEFGRDLQLVVERYLKPLDNPDVPRAVRDNKEIIFTNLKQIADFHNTYVLRQRTPAVK